MFLLDLRFYGSLDGYDSLDITCFCIGIAFVVQDGKLLYGDSSCQIPLILQTIVSVLDSYMAYEQCPLPMI